MFRTSHRPRPTLRLVAVTLLLGFSIGTMAPVRAGGSPPPAATTPPPTLQDRVAALDALLTQRTHDHRFAGTVLVAAHGTVVLTKAYGYADTERRIPNTLSTEFLIGSITKQFTAAAILQLAQAGKLSLKDHLCRYLQGCIPARTRALRTA